MGERASDKKIDNLRDKYFAEAIYDSKSILKAGVLETLDYLDNFMIKKAIATSTFRDKAVELLEVSGIYNRFDLIIYGDDVDNPKPDPEIYNVIVKKLSTNKEKTIILEDSDIGSLAAYNAGIRYILIPDLKIPTEETINNSYNIINSLLNFKEIVLNV